MYRYTKMHMHDISNIQHIQSLSARGAWLDFQQKQKPFADNPKINNHMKYLI